MINGWKRATKGTFEINWLITTLTTMMTGTEVTVWISITDWKNPVSKTLCINTKRAAKKIRVYQSTFRISSPLLGLRSSIGMAPASAITIRGKGL